MHATLSPLDRSVLAVAATAHLAIAVFPLSASGLVAPAWYLALTAVLWLAGAVAIWRLRHTAARLVWLVPLLVLLLWVGGIMLGEQVLGWTA